MSRTAVRLARSVSRVRRPAFTAACLARPITLLVLALATTGCQKFCDGPGQQPLRMAAGPAGSAERACGAAMGEHLAAAAGVKVVVETTPGAVENLRRLREGNVQLAIAGADNLGEAVFP